MREAAEDRCVLHNQNAQATRMITKIPASALVILCENSITVFSWGADGTTSP
jgi:hypothetical protein